MTKNLAARSAVGVFGRLLKYITQTAELITPRCAESLSDSRRDRLIDCLLGYLSYCNEIETWSKGDILLLNHTLFFTDSLIMTNQSELLTKTQRERIGVAFLEFVARHTAFFDDAFRRPDLAPSLGKALNILYELNVPRRGSVLRDFFEKSLYELDLIDEEAHEDDDFLETPRVFLRRLLERTEEQEPLESHDRLDDQDESIDDSSSTPGYELGSEEQELIGRKIEEEKPIEAATIDLAIRCANGLLDCPSVLADRQFWFTLLNDKSLYHPISVLFAQGAVLASPETTGEILVSILFKLQTDECTILHIAAIMQILESKHEDAVTIVRNSYVQGLKEISEDEEVGELIQDVIDSNNRFSTSKLIDELLCEGLREAISKSNWDYLADNSGFQIDADELRSCVIRFAKAVWPKRNKSLRN
jgi:hypothetical protein